MGLTQPSPQGHLTATNKDATAMLMQQMVSGGRDLSLPQFYTGSSQNYAKGRWAPGTASNGASTSGKVSAKGVEAGSDYEGMIHNSATRGSSFNQRGLGALSQQASVDQASGSALLASEALNTHTNGFIRSHSKKTVGQSIAAANIEYSRAGAPATLQNLQLGKAIAAENVKRVAMTSGGEQKGLNSLTYQAHQRPRVTLTGGTAAAKMEQVDKKLGSSIETSAADSKKRTLINLFPD